MLRPRFLHTVKNLWNPTREVRRMYSGEVNHENITGIFEGAADFIVRRLCCNGVSLYAYAIDGTHVHMDVNP